MSYVISWVGTKDGQGLTTTLLSVAFEIAHSHSVLVVDADMSGTSTALDHLHLHPHGRGMNNLVGMSKITQDTLLRQVIQTRHPRVHLVPGLMAICGTGTADFIGQLERGGALADLPYDFVLFDMGAAWSHALLESPRSAAQAVGRISARVFVLMHDSPARIARSIQVLQAAQPPRATGARAAAAFDRAGGARALGAATRDRGGERRRAHLARGRGGGARGADRGPGAGRAARAPAAADDW